MEERETFAWYGVQRDGKDENNELFYIDATNADDEKPIPPPVDLVGPHRLKLGKKILLSADDTFKKIVETDEEDTIPQTHRADDRSRIGLKLQSWASAEHSLEAEASRFLKYITHVQKQCKNERLVGCPAAGCPKQWPLNICFQELKQQRQCIVYSFRTSFPTLDFENEMADVGCEVHVFDPTQKATRFVPRAQHTGEVKRNIVFHRITLDWRDTVPELDLFGPPSLRAKNLQTIMTELGHTEVEILRTDLESSEWKIIESLLVDGWIGHVNQIIMNIHLHWSGFEVSGSKPDVVRFWYSVLYGLQMTNFGLFSSTPNTKAPKIFLGEVDKFNASSCYTLGWMRKL